MKLQGCISAAGTGKLIKMDGVKYRKFLRECGDIRELGQRI